MSTSRLNCRAPLVVFLAILGFISLLPQAADAATVDIDWKLNTIGDATIEVGDTVRWTWGDTFPHTVTANGGEFDSGTLSGLGSTFEFTFNSPGDFAYLCGFHPGNMTGTITVLVPAPAPLTPEVMFLGLALALIVAAFFVFRRADSASQAS